MLCCSGVYMMCIGTELFCGGNQFEYMQRRFCEISVINYFGVLSPPSLSPLWLLRYLEKVDATCRSESLMIM